MLTEFGGLSFHPASGEPWFGYATASTPEEYLGMVEALFDAIHGSPELSRLLLHADHRHACRKRTACSTRTGTPSCRSTSCADIITRASQAIPTEALDAARRKAMHDSTSGAAPEVRAIGD